MCPISKFSDFNGFRLRSAFVWYCHYLSLTLLLKELVKLLIFCAFLHFANKMEKEYFCVCLSYEDKIVKCFWGLLFWKMLLWQESINSKIRNRSVLLCSRSANKNETKLNEHFKAAGSSKKERKKSCSYQAWLVLSFADLHPQIPFLALMYQVIKA